MLKHNKVHSIRQSARFLDSTSYSEQLIVYYSLHKNQGNETSLFVELSTLQLPNYHRLDFSLKYQFLSKNETRSSFGLSILNLYNQNNITRIQYYTDYKLDPVGTSVFERTGFLFTPNISWEIIF